MQLGQGEAFREPTKIFFFHLRKYHEVFCLSFFKTEKNTFFTHVCNCCIKHLNSSLSLNTHTQKPLSFLPFLFQFTLRGFFFFNVKYLTQNSGIECMNSGHKHCRFIQLSFVSSDPNFKAEELLPTSVS